MISFVPVTRTLSSVGVECYQYQAAVVFPNNLAIKTPGRNDFIFLYLFFYFCYNIRNPWFLWAWEIKLLYYCILFLWFCSSTMTGSMNRTPTVNSRQASLPSWKRGTPVLRLLEMTFYVNNILIYFVIYVIF